MYPLLTNDRTLAPAQVLEAHKGQPTIEKRFEQIKTVHEISPVFLKNEGRIEALFTLYFLGLLVQALIERELRLAMQRQRIAELPLYPEQRRCKRPTTEQVLRLFSLVERHVLLDDGNPVQGFEAELTDLQRQGARPPRRPHPRVPFAHVGHRKFRGIVPEKCGTWAEWGSIQPRRAGPLAGILEYQVTRPCPRACHGVAWRRSTRGEGGPSAS